MDKIREHLYVSNADIARRKGEEFDEVVSLASPPECSTKEFLIDDGEHDYVTFKNSVDYIISKIDEEDDVLVHCSAGISRSVSACIATICVIDDVEFEEAYDECSRGFHNPAPQLVESAKKYISEKN